MAGRASAKRGRRRVVPQPTPSEPRQEVDKRQEYLIAKTDITIFGETYSRGQYFPRRLFLNLAERRQEQLQELHYIREPELNDGLVQCDQCGGEFCRSEFINRHCAEVHGGRARIDLDGPQLGRGEDPRRPIEREAPVLSDAEFEARVAV